MFARRRGFTFESLEPRQVLSAHAVAQGFAAVQSGFKHDHIPAAIAGNLQGNFHASITALHANLTDPADTSVVGTVNYFSAEHRGDSKALFVAAIRGADANTTYDVAIDGTVVGQITTNANGNGRLIFSSRGRGSTETFPDNFPTDLAAGVTVKIGDATGELNSRFANSGDADRIRLASFLSDPDSSVRATVNFSSETEDDGTTETKMVVKVAGADANTSLDVTIDGVTVGTITTNARGRGTLVLSSEDGTLPATFPATFESGADVTVGTATGSLHDVAHFGRHR